MKINKKIIATIVGMTVLLGTVGYAATVYLADEVTYTNPEGEEITVQSALNDLYGKVGNADEVEYEGLTIKMNPTTHKFEHFYNGTQIEPLYWYGYEANDIGLTPWYENNNRPTMTRNDKSLSYQFTRTSSSCSIGGVTYGKKIDLSKYTKMHIVLNDTNITLQFGLYPMMGNVGGNLGNERKSFHTLEYTEPGEYVIDVSTRTGVNYIGFETWSNPGGCEIAAWWLE